VSQNFVGTVANEEIAGFQIMAFSDRFSQHGQLDRDKVATRLWPRPQLPLRREETASMGSLFDIQFDQILRGRLLSRDIRDKRVYERTPKTAHRDLKYFNGRKFLDETGLIPASSQNI
jgi:hypothetical protein